MTAKFKRTENMKRGREYNHRILTAIFLSGAFAGSAALAIALLIQLFIRQEVSYQVVQTDKFKS